MLNLLGTRDLRLGGEASDKDPRYIVCDMSLKGRQQYHIGVTLGRHAKGFPWSRAAPL